MQELTIYRLDKPQEVWPLFAPHHYLRNDLSRGSRAWLGVLDGVPIAFTSAIFMPSGTLKDAWREHRTVVLPDYQGLGYGLRIAEWVGELHILDGKRYYSRTTHPRIGEARNRSPLWRATEKNMQMRKPEWKNAAAADTTRLAYSHEYVGATPIKHPKVVHRSVDMGDLLDGNTHKLLLGDLPVTYHTLGYMIRSRGLPLMTRRTGELIVISPDPNKTGDV